MALSTILQQQSTWKLITTPNSPEYICDDEESVHRIKSTTVLFLLHISLIILLSRGIYCLLRRFQQPRIISDILAGTILGPTLPYLAQAVLPDEIVYGLIQPVSAPTNPDWFELRTKYMQLMYPPRAIQLIRTFASLALMLKVFLTGVKTDPAIMIHTGRKALVISLSSMLLPYLVTGPIAIGLKGTVLGDNLNQYDVSAMDDNIVLVFIMSTSSTTFFTVLSDILSEIGFLNTELGRISMSASLLQVTFAVIFFSIYGALRHTKYSVMDAIYVIVSGFFMVSVIVIVFRRWMQSIVEKTADGAAIKDKTVFKIVLCVLVAGLLSDAFGCTPLAGPVLMGLVIPDGPPLGTLLLEKLDLVVSEMLMPLIFLDAGMSIDLMSMPFLDICVTLHVLLLSTYVLKFVGTLVPALCFQIPLRNAALLGLIMNFRGLIEVVNYLFVKNDHALSGATYTNIMVSTLLITAICVPIVSTFYDPLDSNHMLGNRTIQHLKPHSELRVLVSLPEEEAVPEMMNILEAIWGNQRCPMCVYPLHLEDMKGRANSSLIAHKNQDGVFDPSHMDKLLNAFIIYEHVKQGGITMLPYTAIAPYKNIHQDICSLAAAKNVALAIMPFQRKDMLRTSKFDRTIHNMVAPVIATAPCSVGVVVYHQHNSCPLPFSGHFSHHINVFFWGGPDDREALSIAARMARHPDVYMKVVRFVSPKNNNVILEREFAIDDRVFEEFQTENGSNHRTIIEVVKPTCVEETVAAIRAVDRDCDLVIVGRKHSEGAAVTDGLEQWVEFPELGLVGDMLASSDFDDCSFSILVIQQHQHQR